MDAQLKRVLDTAEGAEALAVEHIQRVLRGLPGHPLWIWATRRRLPGQPEPSRFTPEERARCREYIQERFGPPRPMWPLPPTPPFEDDDETL